MGYNSALKGLVVLTTKNRQEATVSFGMATSVCCFANWKFCKKSCD